MTSPAINSSRLLKKINIISSKPRPFRVAVLGQNGVGKTALAVRFVTRRYIGEYDPLLERVYTCQRSVHGHTVDFEVQDTACLNENSRLREHIRWSDAVVLMYDITDRCSFNECTRLKFLVNSHAKKARRKSATDPEAEVNIPVALVGNKQDKEKDRMVSAEEGVNRSLNLNCVNFSEVSVREDLEDIFDIFYDLYAVYRKQRKSRSLTLGASKLSLNSEKTNGSSSEDDAEVKDTMETGSKSRKGNLFSRAISPLPSDKKPEKLRSRRREAFLTFS